ncbi:MAG: N-acetylgalactosamine 6-sulfate sulfatase [Planctomycetes bacterium]|nr:N-acetylgalactosamine 6-sulfate sulfatase [Planctomycetota bacterium]
MSGRSVLSLSIFLFCAPLLPASGETRSQSPPNVLIILVDDLGYGDLSSYGATDLRTPHTDRLIAEGLRFDQFYANCPVCSPTRAALLTGRYQNVVGVPGVIRTIENNNWGYLSPDAVMLPQLLSQAGYDTAMVGKWHLGLSVPNIPNRRGFDFFHGFLGDMMDDYWHHRRHGNNYMRLNEKVIQPEGHATDLFSQWACDYLETRKGKSKPFFLYLAYNAPHTPIQPPKEFLEKVVARESGINESRAKLVALIEHMDDGIGRVMATLKEIELDRSTLVIFTSDNGGQLNVGANNGPLRDGKQSMYEGGLKVAAGCQWLGQIQSGTRSNLSAMSMDIFATVCDVAGITVDHPIDGVSFLPTLLGKEQPPLRKQWFFTRREGGVRYGGKTIEAVRIGDWKLLQNSPFSAQELYNLKEDPQETNNLASKRVDKFRELAAAMRMYIQRGGAVPWQRPSKAAIESDR